MVRLGKAERCVQSPGSWLFLTWSIIRWQSQRVPASTSTTASLTFNLSRLRQKHQRRHDRVHQAGGAAEGEVRLLESNWLRHVTEVTGSAGHFLLRCLQPTCELDACRGAEPQERFAAGPIISSTCFLFHSPDISK